MKLFSHASYVGVDLGSFTIKVVQLEGGSGGYHLSKFGVCPTPPGAIKDGMVLDVPAVSTALKNLLKGSQISSHAAVVAAAGGSVFVRPVAFPKIPTHLLRKSLRVEASRYIPGDANENEIEFEVIGDLEDGQMNVLIVSASKEVVASRALTCEAAGLTVEAVEIEPFAMYRALVESDGSQEPRDETMALIDIGAAVTNVSIVHNGTFVVNRTVPNGGRMWTEALKSHFKLDQADAEIGKARINVLEVLETPAEGPDTPLGVLQPHLDDLVREIRRSLNYFQSQKAEGGAATRKVSRIVMAGGGAKLGGLATYMERKLGLPILCAGIFESERFSLGQEFSESGLDLAVATGLAMRGSLRRAA